MIAGGLVSEAPSLGTSTVVVAGGVVVTADALLTSVFAVASTYASGNALKTLGKDSKKLASQGGPNGVYRDASYHGTKGNDKKVKNLKMVKKHLIIQFH